MAARAVPRVWKLRRLCGHVIGDGIHVALQAQEALLAADQQHAVDAAVRRVAGDAAFDFRSRMLEDKRSALFGVAADAGL